MESLKLEWLGRGAGRNRFSLQPLGCCFSFENKPTPIFSKKLYIVVLLILVGFFAHILCF